MKNFSDPTPEELLGGLGRLLEDERREGEDGRVASALERLTRGELDAAELARLEARSKDEPALRRALEAHRPLDPEVCERISQNLLKESAGAAPLGERAARASARPAVDSAARALGPAAALRSRRRVFWAAVPVLAAAAALFLWPKSPSFEPLARYAIEVQGAAVPLRGAEGASNGAEAAAAPTPTLQVEPKRELTVLLRPAVPDPDLTEAQAFLERAGQVQPFESSVARSSSGALRLTLRVPDLTEPSQLLIVVARPGVSMPGVAAAQAASGPGWQRFRFELTP